MPPSLSDSVGVPTTVTASLRSSVKVMALPAFSVRLPGTGTTSVTVGVAVSICNGPVSVVTAPAILATWPGPPVGANDGPGKGPVQPAPVTLYHPPRLFWVQIAPLT